MWLVALDSSDQAFDVRKKQLDEKYFFIMEKFDFEKFSITFFWMKKNNFEKYFHDLKKIEIFQENHQKLLQKCIVCSLWENYSAALETHRNGRDPLRCKIVS